MNRHDVAIRDDDGHLETVVTITPLNGDDEQAEAVAALIADEYQTTEDVAQTVVRDAE